MSGIRLRSVEDARQGEWLQWDHATWYQLTEDAKNVGGWCFLHFQGHPIKCCTIWHNVELPWKPVLSR